jgi:hypothetical protein
MVPGWTRACPGATCPSAIGTQSNMQKSAMAESVRPVIRRIALPLWMARINSNPEFPVWNSDSRIVPVLLTSVNEFATRAGLFQSDREVRTARFCPLARASKNPLLATKSQFENFWFVVKFRRAGPVEQSALNIKTHYPH